jgi:hypothetical protein
MAYPATNGKPVFHEFMTPLALVCHLYHDKPQLKFKDQFQKEPDIDPETGLQKAEYKVTLAWHKSRVGELNEMIVMANQTKGEAWPQSLQDQNMLQPAQRFILQPFFRDGDNPEHNTKARDYLFGRYYLNLKCKATAKRDPNNPQVILYSGAPGLCGPNGGDHQIAFTDIYPGCTARASGIMFGTEFMGKNFISTRLNNIQLFEQGERIGGGGRPTPQSQFGSLLPGAAQNAMAGLGGLLG